MPARDFYTLVADRFRFSVTDEAIAQLLETVSVEWEMIRQRDANAEDAEVCRLAMLLAAKLNLSTVAVWRARAMSRYVAIGWQEGVGALLLSEALTVLARVNSDYPSGRYLDCIRPSDEAQAILDELTPFTSLPGSGIRLGPGAPSPGLVARFMHENRGFLFVVAGRLLDAHDSFLTAHAMADSPRGRLKCELWLALIEYLQNLDKNSADSCATTTVALCAEAHELVFPDLAEAASFNASEMEQRSRHLVPYAII